MTRKVLNITLSVVVASFFIWLAIRSIDLAELAEEIRTVTYYWLPFFFIIVLISHFFRAERWRLLLKEKDQHIPRSTLFAGVMMGYMFNNIVPRLGEITRPVYVAKKRGLSSSKLIGTIVIERLVDVASMLILLIFAALYLISDISLLQQVFGIQNWSWHTYLIIPGILLLVITGIWIFYRVLVMMDEKSVARNPLVARFVESGRSFGEGMISLKNVKNWPLFLLFTAGIWGGYVLMTYIPFFMMNLQDVFDLSLADAVVLTMVSSVGVSVPTPAGIGSYHLFIQQSMWLLYEVPLVKALTYATVAHISSVLIVFLIAPVSVWWDKYYTLKSNV